ncbi:site-specific DNA-methyltransferase [Actinokineospora sp. HBU206404]|uniref:Methyltransferase n=2 Tax=Actinokineospora xionganensis TaxID=2684470 RepID=A0ABR7LG42_9PSEU|nr:site-specific DNA-methyltransferase [Actinokineospora xionganensis]
MAGMADESVDSIVTSPPYWGLRDYGVPGQYGQESSVRDYVNRLRGVFTQARRVLARDGTLWLNLGDVYGGSWHNYVAPGSTATTAADPRRRSRGTHLPPQAAERYKNLLGLPWQVAFALVDDGWTLRNAIVWHKPNAMPESVRDRLSCRYEMLFLLVRSRRYWFDLDPIREPVALREGTILGGPSKSRRGAPAEARRYGQHQFAKYDNCEAFGDHEHGSAMKPTGERHSASHPHGRNPGDVWSIPTRPYRGAHFAVSPIDIPLRCIAAGCRPDGTVLDPFSGAGTTGVAALSLGRSFIGIDVNPEFHELARSRFAPVAGDDR